MAGIYFLSESEARIAAEAVDQTELNGTKLKCRLATETDLDRWFRSKKKPKKQRNTGGISTEELLSENYKYPTPETTQPDMYSPSHITTSPKLNIQPPRVPSQNSITDEFDLSKIQSD